MEAVLERPRTKWTAPTRKLTEEEIEEILANWDYDPSYYDDDDSDEVAPIWDKYGNPTRETLDAMYESRHGLCEEMTVEEAIAEIHAACSGN